MADGARIDWRAIPRRYRTWRALPAWRKVLWVVGRGLTMVVAYVGFGAAILWYNEPDVVGGVAAGRQPVWAVAGLLAGRPELLLVLAILVPAVVAAVLLPHRPSWR
jgi:hypothetical protein